MKKTASLEIPPFAGFSRRTVTFFRDLAKNNNKEWFAAHRPDYETQVLLPAKSFVVALGARLKTIVPTVAAVPAVNKSIFRIFRDTRFSLDPTPYKTNLGLYFWDMSRSRLEGAGFYVHLEPPMFMLGAGMYMFPKPFLGRFRAAVVDPKKGRKLTGILEDIRGLGGWEIGGAHYKKIPAGCDPKHPNAPLLLHTGLWAGREEKIPEVFFTAGLVDYCFELLRPLRPLHRWLSDLQAGALKTGPFQG